MQKWGLIQKLAGNELVALTTDEYAIKPFDGLIDSMVANPQMDFSDIKLKVRHLQVRNLKKA